MAKRIVSLQPGFDTGHQVMVDIARATRLSNAFFFFLAGSKFTLYPFLTIFFRLLGLNALQTGLICGFRAFVPLIAVPLWSACARKFNRRRFVIAFSAFMLIAVNISLTLVPPVDSDETLMFCRKYNGTYHGELTNIHTVKHKSNSTSTHIIVETQINQTSPLANKTKSVTTVEFPSSTTLEPVLNSSHKNSFHNTKPVIRLTSVKGTVRNQTTRSWTNDVFGGIQSYKDENNTEKEGTPTHVETAKINTDTDSKTTKPSKSTFVGSKTKVTKPTSFTDKVFGGKPEYKDNEESNPKHNSTFVERMTRGIPPTLHHIADEVTGKIHVWKQKVYAMEYRTFIIILAILFVGEILSSSIDKVAHNSWFEYLDSVDDLEKYGKQHIWTALGAILFSLSVTAIVDNTECMLQYKIHHFMIHFYLFSAIMAVVFLLTLYFPINHDTKQRRVSSKCSTLCRVICGDMHAVTFIITAAITGIVSAPMNNFIFWKVLDVGGTEIQMGLSVTVAYISEFIMLLVGKRFIKMLGFQMTVTIGLIALCVRLLYYSFLWDAWAIVPIEVLHGFSNTAVWMAITSYPDFNQSPRLGRSTLQTMQFLYYNVGYGCGSLLSGFLYYTFSLEVVFQGSCIFVLIWAVLFTILQKCYKKPQHVRYSRLLMDDNMSDSSETYEDDWLEMALKEH